MAAPVPKFTIRRLSLYLRQLETLSKRGVTTTKSRDLAASLELTDAQVRRDFACFGQFGRPGIGYHVNSLIDNIKTILGITQVLPVALVGVGNLGRALLMFKGFLPRGFLIKAAFDNDPAKIGQHVGDVRIQPVQEMASTIPSLGIQLAIISTTAENVNKTAEQLVSAGVRGILNFTAAQLRVPPNVEVTNVDLAVLLEGLAYYVNLPQEKRKEPPQRVP